MVKRNMEQDTSVPCGEQVKTYRLMSNPSKPQPSSRSQVAFDVIQEWEGYVRRVDQNEIFASLIDLTAGATYESDDARIPIEEISEKDTNRIVVGSIFRWIIGYERSPDGTQKRVSQIVFLDQPGISERDYEKGKKWARKVLQSIHP